MAGKTSKLSPYKTRNMSIGQKMPDISTRVTNILEGQTDGWTRAILNGPLKVRVYNFCQVVPLY